MVMVRGFEFSLRELAGGLGDVGTFLPFTIGYIVLSGFDPTGIMVGIGLTHIVLALAYRLPIPVQPMKVIGSLALAERWRMNQVLGAGFSMGIITSILSSSDRVNRTLKKIPSCVVRGIIVSLGLKLLLRSLNLVNVNLLVYLSVVLVSLLLLSNKIVPSSIFLVLFGFTYSIIIGDLNLNGLTLGFSTPTFHIFSLNNVIIGFLSAGLIQLFLTITNAVIATMALIHDLFPDRKDITPQKLMTNMGVINLISPFMGGIPLCHGSGGLSAQYLFGARTGGAILMLGFIELFLGLFLSSSLLTIFSAFPLFILGVMLLLTSLELLKVVTKVKRRDEIAVMLLTVITSVTINFALGVFVGTCVHYLKERSSSKVSATLIEAH